MIIGSRWRYEGDFHRYLRDHVVEIVAVLRGNDPDDRAYLSDDRDIGELRDDDWVEIAPIIVEGGKERRSFVTSDARRSELRMN